LNVERTVNESLACESPVKKTSEVKDPKGEQGDLLVNTCTVERQEKSVKRWSGRGGTNVARVLHVQTEIVKIGQDEMQRNHCEKVINYDYYL
jgi:hypothetical protein